LFKRFLKIEELESGIGIKGRLRKLAATRHCPSSRPRGRKTPWTVLSGWDHFYHWTKKLQVVGKSVADGRRLHFIPDGDGLWLKRISIYQDVSNLGNDKYDVKEHDTMKNL
jgi:hypothetical protein